MGVADDLAKIRGTLTQRVRALAARRVVRAEPAQRPPVPDGAECAPEVVDAAVRHPDEMHAALVRRYFGDTTPGASMERFLAVCSLVVEERDAAMARLDRMLRVPAGRA